MREKLHSKSINDKVYFYFGEKLIFSNSKSMPFIVLKSGKKGEEVFTSFSECGIVEEENGFFVVFKNGDRKISFTLKEERDTLSFYSDVALREGEEICLTFYKGRHDVIYGLPAFKEEEPAPPKRRSLFLMKQKVLQKEKVTLHKKLAYFIPGRYYFDNKTVTDYDVEIKDNIYITIRSDRPSFSLLFYGPIKNVYAYKERYNEKIKKHPRGSVFLKTDRIDIEKIETFIKSHDDLHVKGVILNKKPYDLAFLQVEKRKCKQTGLDFLCCIGKRKEEETIQSYLNKIRKYLDLLIDGLYFYDDFSQTEITEIKHGLPDVLKEYPFPVTVFHNVLSEEDGDFGYFIIKDTKIIENFSKYFDHYYYSGERIIGKEEKTYTSNKLFKINIIDI